jgi:GDPmannose 4,6-dehydratase
MKRALITGITGQDGSYLAELLLEKGYEVHGVIRRNSAEIVARLESIQQHCHLHYGDLTDPLSLSSVISHTRPDEIYNLGAQSHVKVSFDSPLYTGDCVGLGTARVLDAIRIHGLIPTTRFYQAGTSEMFGEVQKVPQDENTPFYPRSPYGAAKLYAYWITRNYRESYGLFGCTGILFNHESPRRGNSFVTQKIVHGLRDISLGKLSILELGNLSALRDWGHAKDYVEAMWLMLQQEKPDDYVISSGEQISVRDFAEKAANYFGMEIEWRGEGLKEVGIDKTSQKEVIRVNPAFFRPAEVETLVGDPTKAKTVLGWKPKYNLETLVEDMCLHAQGWVT